MVIVVAKLFLVDLGNTGTLARVVSFLGVGLLLLVVGYFAPVPPRAAVEARAREDGSRERAGTDYESVPAVSRAMSKVSTSTRAAAAAVGVALAATAAALDPQQFVAGWPIEVPSGAEVFDVPLTADVYAAASSLDQLAVLDANGEPQAFFRRTPAPCDADEQGVVLDASPLYVGGTASRAERRRHDERARHVGDRDAGCVGRARDHRLRARRARRRAGADRARARLACVAAAVPARRRRRAKHGSHELAQRRPSVRRRALDRRRRSAARARARARELPAGTIASRRAATSPIGSCCAQRSSALPPKPVRRRA